MYVAITRARKRLYLTLRADAHAARADALQPALALLRRAAAGALKWLTPRFAQKRKPSTFTAGAFTRAVKRDPRFGGAPAGTGGAPSGFRVGQNVVHAKFGAGVIVDAEGQGTDARVQVNFGRQGVKWLAVAVAKLQGA